MKFIATNQAINSSKTTGSWVLFIVTMVIRNRCAKNEKLFGDILFAMTC